MSITPFVKKIIIFRTIFFSESSLILFLRQPQIILSGRKQQPGSGVTARRGSSKYHFQCIFAFSGYILQPAPPWLYILF